MIGPHDLQPDWQRQLAERRRAHQRRLRVIEAIALLASAAVLLAIGTACALLVRWTFA